MAAKKAAVEKKKAPKRVRFEMGFEVERDVLPPKEDLDRAFRAAIEEIVKVGENWYRGNMRIKFVRR